MSKNHSMDRRSFLKSSLSGATGLVILGAGAGRSAVQQEKPQPKVVSRTLGKTGIKLPVVSMGVMNADNPHLVSAALDAGIVHLDTANSYQRGRNEEMIGKVIKDRPRDSFVISTKIKGERRYKRGQSSGEQSLEKDCLNDLDISLQRLGLDYVDILYIHGVRSREETLSKPVMKALEKARKDGKTRFTGVSTHSNEPEVLEAAVESRFYDVVLTAYNFKQDHREEMKAAIAKAAGAGIGIVGMKTLAGGYLDEEKTRPVDPKAAIKWVLQDPNVTTVIPGFTTYDQLNADVSVMADLDLSEPERKSLELGALMDGFYCQGCERCLGQCRSSLPVPDLMRAYMYANSYRNLGEAHDLLVSLDLPAAACSDCEECTVQCVSGFDVSRKIKDVARLREIPLDFLV